MQPITILWISSVIYFGYGESSKTEVHPPVVNSGGSNEVTATPAVETGDTSFQGIDARYVFGPASFLTVGLRASESGSPPLELSSEDQTKLGSSLMLSLVDSSSHAGRDHVFAFQIDSSWFMAVVHSALGLRYIVVGSEIANTAPVKYNLKLSKTPESAFTIREVASGLDEIVFGKNQLELILGHSSISVTLDSGKAETSHYSWDLRGIMPQLFYPATNREIWTVRFSDFDARKVLGKRDVSLSISENVPSPRVIMNSPTFASGTRYFSISIFQPRPRDNRFVVTLTAEESKTIKIYKNSHFWVIKIGDVYYNADTLLATGGQLKFLSRPDAAK